MHLIFENVFNNMYMEVFTPSEFLMVLFSGLLAGFMLSLFASYRAQFSSEFIVTVAMLPVIVGCIILVVSDNIGTGVAVAGAFSLVRFRSKMGRARTIVFIFFAMGSGLLVGTGYPAFAIVFVAIMGAIYLAWVTVYGTERRIDVEHRWLSIAIPEDLCKEGLFTDIFSKYTSECTLVSTKEINSGCVYKMTYDAVLIAPDREKSMIDEIRCRNGNLEVSISSMRRLVKTGL